MQTPVSVAIAGYGYWGPNLARNFHQLPGSVLSAVCDPDADRRCHFETVHPGVEAFSSFEKMLARADFDALVVATPVSRHCELAQAALEAGKHVLVEKPMAASAAECRKLIGIADSGNRILMVGHTYLYSEAIRTIFDIIDGGEIGEVRYINCQRLNFGLFQQDINVVWDLAPHDLSIIQRVMGRMPETVNCQGSAALKAGVEAVANTSLSFANGGFATVQSSWLEPRKVRQMTFVGTRKMIVFDDLEPHGKIRIYDTRVDFPPHYDDFAEFQYSYHYGECRIPHLEHREPLRTMCTEFIDAIRAGRDPQTSGRHGLEVVNILEACTASLRRGGEPVKPQPVN